MWSLDKLWGVSELKVDEHKTICSGEINGRNGGDVKDEEGERFCDREMSSEWWLRKGDEQEMLASSCMRAMEWCSECE